MTEPPAAAGRRIRGFDVSPGPDDGALAIAAPVAEIDAMPGQALSQTHLLLATLPFGPGH